MPQFTLTLLLICLVFPVLSTASTNPQTFLTLTAINDYVGGNRQVTFTTNDGTFTSYPNPTSDMTVEFQSSSENWNLIFSSPRGLAFAPGEYENAQRAFSGNPAQPGLDVSGDGSGCNQTAGRFLISEVNFNSNGSIGTLALDFEQHCDGLPGVLYGSLRINSAVPAVPQLALASHVALKGNVGTNDATVLISLSMPSANPVTVEYATQDGSAVQGTDYLPATGSVTFAPNTTAVPITISILGDRLARGNQSFSVGLSASSGPPIAVATTAVEILDPNVPLTVLSLYGKPGAYLDNGFVIVLNQGENIVNARIVSGGPIYFDIPVSGGDWQLGMADKNNLPPARGTYTQAVNAPLKLGVYPYLSLLAPGAGCNRSSGQFTVLQAHYTAHSNIKDFAADFKLQCDKTPELFGSIRYNSPFQQLSVSDAVIDGSGSTASFHVTLNPASTHWVAVTFQTSDATAIAGTDYVAMSKTVYFAPGTQDRIVDVPLLTSNGGAKSFSGQLTAPLYAPVWIQKASAAF
jgi:hypothetical protein